MKRSFFQAAVVSILLNGCTTWTLIKCMEKKLVGNYTRMLRAILNKLEVGVMVIVVGNEHDDTSANPGRDRLHFT